MNVKTNSKKGSTISERRLAALELRIAGYNFRIIGKKLNVSHVTAYKYVNDALEESRVKLSIKGDQLRELELRRLDILILECNTILRKSSKETTRLMASDKIIKIMERRAKLTGLDIITDSMSEIEDIDEEYI